MSMKTLKIATLLSLVFLLSACSAFNRTVTAETEAPVVIHPVPPDQLSMREVDWMLFNREKLEQLLAENPDSEIVLFTLTAKGYENLSLNMQEIIRYLQDQKNIILYYRRSFPTPEELITE